MKMALDSPDTALSNIHVPDVLEKVLGYAEKGDSVLVFSDIYGSNGGRRIGKETALHPGRTYYIVAKQSIMRGSAGCFDFMNKVGLVRGSDDLAVWSVFIGSVSARRDDANRWLYRYGYTLSEVDMTAHPVWPPTLRSTGVDEPLFQMSDVVYKTPYMANDNKTDVDRPSNIGYNTALKPGMRVVGFIGMGRGVAAQKELEGDCLFIRPSRFQAWNAMLASKTPAQGLEPIPAEQVVTASRYQTVPVVGKGRRAHDSGSQTVGERQEYEKPRFGNYSRASVCAILRDPKGKIYELRRIMDYVGRNEFRWVFPGPADNRSFRFGKPFPQGSDHPLRVTKINVDDVNCDFVFLRWSPRPWNGNCILVDTEPGSLKNHPVFYEVIDISWYSHDDDSLQWLFRGITYYGVPTDKVLVRYRRRDNGLSDALLLGKDDFDVDEGTLRLRASTADTAPGFTIDDSKIHAAPKIKSNGNFRRLMYTSSNLGETTGVVRIRRRDSETVHIAEAPDRDQNRAPAVQQEEKDEEPVPVPVQAIEGNLVSQGLGPRNGSSDAVNMLAKGLAATMNVCGILIVPACFAKRVADALAFTRDRMCATEVQDLEYMFDNASSLRTYLIDGSRKAPIDCGRLSRMVQKRQGLFVIPFEGIDEESRRDAAFWNKAFLVPADDVVIEGKPGGTRFVLPTNEAVSDDGGSAQETSAMAERLSELIGGKLSDAALEFASDVLSRRMAYGNGAGKWIWRQLVCQTFAAFGTEQAVETAKRLNRETPGRAMVEMLMEVSHAEQAD